MYSIILAGGRGDKLGYHTDNRPKPLLEIAGRTILEHQILQAKSAGICDFILLENYRANMIQREFSDGLRFGVSITHMDLPLELGNAGAIRHAVQKLPKTEDDVLVMTGDILSNVDLSKMIDQSRATRAPVTDLAIKWQIPYTVLQDGDVEWPIIEKPTININGEIYVLRKELWSPNNLFPEYGDLVRNVFGDLGGLLLSHYKHEGFWLKIDTPIDVVLAEQNREKWLIQDTITFGKERRP